MKNTGLYIIGGATLLLVAALAAYEYRNRPTAVAMVGNPPATDTDGTPLATQKFRGFKFGLTLNSSTKQAIPEITALQRMINAYYNGSDSVDVTGVYDTQTKNAVKDITGKTSTSLNEFNLQHLIQKRGEKVAVDLITSMTITGK